MLTPDEKRCAVAHLCDQYEVSERRACKGAGADRSMVRYQSRRGDDAELRAAIKPVSSERRRLGCLRIHVMIEQEGFAVNHKKPQRICRKEGLQLRKRGGRSAQAS